MRRAGQGGLVVVGELNPYGVDPRLALFHLPRGASGDRLRKILGLTDVAYHKLHKVNLCSGRWSDDAAKLAAWKLIDEEHTVMVLLGSKVRMAFGGPPVFKTATLWGRKLVGLPHPSGRCRVWNDSRNVHLARELLKRVAPQVPWGEAGEVV